MIFCFGSNLSGIHGAGAALFAHRHHGAEYGIGEGLTGNSYALPTKGLNITFMDFTEVQEHVEKFILFATENPGLQFQVTRIGCGLAGFTDEQIAPLFTDAPSNCLFDSAWKQYLPSVAFWGTI